MPMVFAAGPGTISIVAGANGTDVLTDPRVATVAQAAMLALVAAMYCPRAALNELVSDDARLGRPELFTTAMRDEGAVEQITDR